MKKKHKALKIILLLIVVVAIAVFVVWKINKTPKSDDGVPLEKADEAALEAAEIDVNDEAYAGMEFYQDGDNVVIEGKDGNRTIITNNKSDGSNETTISEEEKANYPISDIQVTEASGQTVITGKISNKTAEIKNITLNVKFYSEDEKVKSATKGTVTVEANGTSEFTMQVQDSVSQYRCDVTVENIK